MASHNGSRSPSPFSSPSDTEYGTLPQQLTPRSKVKAMLAAIDDGFDPKDTPKLVDPGSKEVTPATAANEWTDSEGDAEGEESDVAPVKPKGKLAARLQRDDTLKDSSYKDEEHANAYERIKMQLLRGPARNSGSLPTDSIENMSEDNDELQTDATQRIRRAATDYNRSQPPSERRITSQRSSPGLFVSPKSASQLEHSNNLGGNHESDSDLPPDSQVSSKVLKLVARKRAEREAREAGEAHRRPSQHQKTQGKKLLSGSYISSSNISDDDVDHREEETKLALQARPTRKASKKALEEMNRETQRMSRNMQLTHQAKTKKKVTKESFFARFNYRTSDPTTPGTVQGLSSSTAASSTPVSEFEGVQEAESPPTSPPSTSGIESQEKPIGLPELNQTSVLNALNFGTGVSTTDIPIAHMEDLDSEFPSIFKVVNPPEELPDKGKDKADLSSRERSCGPTLQQKSEKPSKPVSTQPRIRVRPQKTPQITNTGGDSDSDLEIVPIKTTRTSKHSIFDRLPAGKANEGRSLQTLRALAHLTSPSKQDSRTKASMSLSEMQASLQKRARHQAAAERSEKIQDLKDRGGIVQTAEERERDQMDIENLVEKARMQAEEIMQKEKKAARKEKKANREDDALPDTSDEDEDYQDNEAEESNLELSGSEEEESVDEQDDSGTEAEAAKEAEGVNVAKDQSRPEGLVNAKPSDGSDAEEAAIPMDDEDSDDETNDLPTQRKRRTNQIIDEDDEDEDLQVQASQVTSETVGLAQNPLIPGSSMSGGPAIGIMGMTQAFAATMAESQTKVPGENPGVDQEQDSLAFLGPMPEPNFPLYDLNDSQPMVMDSQQADYQQHTTVATAHIELHFSQSQAREMTMEENQNLPPTATQYSDIPDPTQDIGFALSSPGPEQRFASVPPSTVDTIVLSRATGQETPKAIRKGRLRRRMVATAEDSDGEKADQVDAKENTGFQVSANAFDVLKRSKRTEAPIVDPFDKKKSEAKGMVEEQAQESEDEYAGIGGASDDESGGEEDDEVRKMIEEGEVNVDEGELAAFYADKERATDEKAVEKLFKDINNGLLRRKRGAEFDLSDSEDDAEARQRAKRREFAKMRKALLENENVGKIAEDPKKLAFLRAIEDRDDDENLTFFEEMPKDSSQQQLPDTQEMLNPQTDPLLPESQPGKRKRPLQETTANRPPPAARRARTAHKPSTLAEIRESVSFLIEDPEAPSLNPLDSSDIDEHASKPPTTTTDPFAPHPHRTTAPIIDRISLKRASSSSTSSTTTTTTRLAFQAPTTTTFAVPSLLRRATSTHTSEDKHGISTATATTERAAGEGERGAVAKRGGAGKKSSVVGFAREVERRRVVEGVERRREEGRRRMGREARGLGGLVGVGVFE